MVTVALVSSAAQAYNVNTPSNQGLEHVSAGIGAYSFGNSTKAHSGFVETNGFVNVIGGSGMPSRVLFGCEHFKIADFVIGFVLIDVVDLLKAPQLAAEMFFHEAPMFVDFGSVGQSFKAISFNRSSFSARFCAMGTRVPTIEFGISAALSPPIFYAGRGPTKRHAAFGTVECNSFHILNGNLNFIRMSNDL